METRKNVGRVHCIVQGGPPAVPGVVSGWGKLWGRAGLRWRVVGACPMIGRQVKGQGQAYQVARTGAQADMRINNPLGRTRAGRQGKAIR